MWFDMTWWPRAGATEHEALSIGAEHGDDVGDGVALSRPTAKARGMFVLQHRGDVIEPATEGMHAS